MRYLFLLLLLLAAACAPQAQGEALSVSLPDTPVAVAQVTSESPPVNANGDTLVARVNGQDITRANFERALARTQLGIMAADPAALQATVLDSMIEQVLIEQAAAQANIVIDEAAVEAEYQANRALVASDAAWAQWLADNLLTEAEFRQQIYDLLIAGAMRDQIVSAAPEVASHVHARHILVRSESDAHDVLGQLQNGADFVALAAQYSQDVTTREQGGDLGWFIDGELLEPALSQVAFALEPGQIGGPVVTRLGYHIIQTLERDEQPLSPEKRVLLARLQFENWVRGLTFNAIVERYI